jgi:exopolysaccharide biosynthesis protein
MKKITLYTLLTLFTTSLFAQVNWINVDADFAPLPQNFHVFKTTDSLDGKPFIAYYAEALLQDKNLIFDTDTTYKRRFTPSQFYTKNEKPLLVVNGTFFSFATNANLNVVIKKGKMVAYNLHTIPGRGKDTLTYKHPFASAIGISKKRKADVAWLYTDSSLRKPYALQGAFNYKKDSSKFFTFDDANFATTLIIGHDGTLVQTLKKWKMQTAIGGGPVLLQHGAIQITNEEEQKFAGKAIADAHPRTCMGYTADGKLIVMVIQGRFANAAGATLLQEATLLKNIGCVEALNLDGGGSSCMLINGKETIKPSDKEGQRPNPAVFIISQKK